MLVFLLALTALLCSIRAADFDFGKESPESYYSAVAKAKAATETTQGCSNIDHNVVYCCVFNLDNVHRDWTMDGGLVERIVDNKAVPMCFSIDEIIESAGKLVAERKCNIPYFTPTDVCRAMSRNSNVIFAGDSLMRHIVLSFYILLRNDYHTGLPQPSTWPGYNATSVDKDTGKIFQETHCTCDGQFSESHVCRLPVETEFNNDHQRRFQQYCPAMVQLSDAEGGGAGQTGALPNLAGTQFRISHVHPLLDSWKGHNAYKHLCNSRKGIRTVFLQVGPHTLFNPVESLKNEIDIYLKEIADVVTSCAHNIKSTIRILVSGASYVDKSLYAKYPYQDDWSAERHDLMIEDYLRTKHPYVKFVSFLNLSRDGHETNQDTSDGFHGMTSVNVAKALTVMNIIGRFGTDEPTHPYDPTRIKRYTFDEYIAEKMKQSLYLPWANHINGYNVKYEKKNMTIQEEHSLQKKKQSVNYNANPKYLFLKEGYINKPNHYDRNREIYGGSAHPTPAPGQPQPLPTNEQMKRDKASNFATGESDKNKMQNQKNLKNRQTFLEKQ